MKIKVVCVGKSTDKRVISFLNEYEKRLKHYVKLEMIYVEVKKKPQNNEALKSLEGELIMNLIDNSNSLVLLDEKGQDLSSKQFATFIQKKFNSLQGDLVFVIGGAYGFSEELYERANNKIRLSSMTFTHQMVRIIFIEQVYRALTILKGEKYHH